jgi:hypothetical protein
MTALIHVETGHATRLHGVFIDGLYLSRERHVLPSRQLDPAVSWTRTPRVYSLPLGAIVQDATRVELWEVTPTGLAQISTVDALRRLGASDDLVDEHRLAVSSYALRLGVTAERHRFAEPHGLSTGVQPWPNSASNAYAYVERVTALQAWIRRPTLAEIRVAGLSVT